MPSKQHYEIDLPEIKSRVKVGNDGEYMTYKEARRKLGSRSVRRSGIKVRRGRGGILRKAGKARVAVSVRRLMREANGG